jgi:hypothetical protein
VCVERWGGTFSGPELKQSSLPGWCSTAMPFTKASGAGADEPRLRTDPDGGLRESSPGGGTATAVLSTKIVPPPVTFALPVYNRQV